MPLPLLTTKFFPPPPRTQLVARQRLVQRLEAGLLQGSKLIFISAPAGFGKTTLVVEACRQLAGRLPGGYAMAWLSLDAADNDPNQFWRYVITAIHRVEPAAGELARDMMEIAQPPPIRTVLTSLLNDLSNLSGHLLFVLDDYQQIESRFIHEAVNFLIDHLPPQVQILITTRADAPLALARRRARVEMVEFRAGDLRFTFEETLEFLNTIMRLGLSAQDVETLLRRTEGWVAGLQMAALAMRNIAPSSDIAGTNENTTPAVHSFIANFAGDDQYIGDYLVEEVLQNQPPAVQDFLEKTAVLERFNAELCAWMMEDASISMDLGVTSPVRVAHYRDLLENLDRSNLFLVPLDNRQDWFRYHRLFAELLQRRVRQLHGVQYENDLHIRASSWFETKRLWPESIEHALRASDFQRVARLILSGSDEMFFSVREWTRRLPLELVLSMPELAMTWSWAALATGHIDETKMLLEEIEKRLHLDMQMLKMGRQAIRELPPGDVMILIMLAAQRANIEVGGSDVAHAVILSEDILNCLDRLDHQEEYAICYVYEPVALFNLGLGYTSLGNLEKAMQALARAVVCSRKHNNLHILTMSISHLAQIYQVSGRLDEARETYQEALRVSEEVTGGPSPYISLAYAGLGMVAYEWNDLDTASSQFEKSIKIGDPWNNWETLIPASIGLARVYSARKDYARAIAILDAMDQSWQNMYHSGPLAILSCWRVLLAGEIGSIPGAIGRLEASDEWISRTGIYYTHEMQVLLKARLLIAQKEFTTAKAVLAEMVDSLESGGRNYLLVQALVLQSMVLLGLNNSDQALLLLERAVVLAKPGGMIRAFVDGGSPIATLLNRLSPSPKPQVAEYVAHLLNAFSEGAAGEESYPPARPFEQKTQVRLVGQLSSREIEVLSFLAGGLSNKAIAVRLVITVGTVKVHTNNIYAKLGVNSRGAAVAKARSLGIIA